ncbi:hypothetical protein OUZ56_000102 [Daphnia magna]|uniref:C2H2-type domain-containing protein n=1 Tax=Daphnia magna TaxID=35525 RepID=A0ABQ9ZYP6_9CRUS|nr:hypothetical protein OUZ56_000102 [Daphnia magna]
MEEVLASRSWTMRCTTCGCIYAYAVSVNVVRVHLARETKNRHTYVNSTDLKRPPDGHILGSLIPSAINTNQVLDEL